MTKAVQRLDKFQRAALLLCAAAVALALATLLDPSPNDEPDLTPYRGLGTWLDNFDWATWKDPGTPQRADQTIAAMRRHGVSTLYLATSHHSQPDDVVNPRAVSATIEAAHSHGMKVVAWYQPSFGNPARDLRRALAAIRFETEDGEHVDSFALDIESRTVTPVEERNARLVRLAARLRDEVGPSYALGAIVPSPRLFELYPNSWRDFPFRRLARYFDVFLPMAYWTYHASTFKDARDYTRDSVSGIRRLTRDPDMPVHAIGGTARHATNAGMRGFLSATRRCGTVGLSLYDFLTTSRSSWRAIAERPQGTPRRRRSCAWSLREPAALATARAARLEAEREDRLERRIRAKHAKQQKRRHERNRRELSVRKQQQRDND
jgi:hypothetical protein